MFKKTMALFFVAALFMSAQALIGATPAFAVPAEFKKELNEINKVVRAATSNVIYKKKYDGMAEELDKAEAMLKDLAKRAEVTESDGDIKRALKRIADTRKKLLKALAKKGVVPGSKKPASSTTQSATANFKADLAKVNAIVRSAKGKIYRSSKNYDGLAEELDRAEQMLAEAGKKHNKPATDSGIKRMQRSIDESRKKLAEQMKKAGYTPGAVTPSGGTQATTTAPATQTAETAPPAEDWTAQNAVFDEVKQRLQDLYALMKKLAKGEENDEFFELAKSSGPMIEQSRAVIARIKEGIPDVRKFMEVNEEARKINLRHLANDLGDNLIKRAEHKVEMAVSGLLNQADSDLFSIKQANKPNLAAMDLNRIRKKFEIIDAVKPGDANVAAEKKRIMGEAEKSYQAVLGKVDKTRMPGDTYDGGDLDALKATITKLYAAKYPGDEVRKVVITSDEWIEQAVAEIDNDNQIVAGYYKYIYAQVGVKKTKGCAVYPMGFRKGWTGEGENYGKLQIRSIGVSYPILEKYLGK
jgi:hypothetical protein